MKRKAIPILMAFAMAVAMVIGFAPTTAYAADTITMDEFMKELVASNYNYDGEGVTVEWSPTSGCYQVGSASHSSINGVICPTDENGAIAATGNTPVRVNSHNAQYHMDRVVGSGNGAITSDYNGDVTIKNVNFVFEPAAFTVCENSSWAGSYTAEQATAAQLYFQTSGNVTIEGCTFDKVTVTSFGTTGTSIVKDCTFTNLTDTYGIKDIRGANISVTGCTFENCSGAIMVSQVANETTVDSVDISGNTFTNVGGTMKDRGIVQVASSGDYSGASFVLANNTATSCGSVFRLLNGSATVQIISGEYDVNYLLTDDSSSTSAVVTGGSYTNLAAGPYLKACDGTDLSTTYVLLYEPEAGTYKYEAMTEAEAQERAVACVTYYYPYTSIVASDSLATNTELFKVYYGSVSDIPADGGEITAYKVSFVNSDGSLLYSVWVSAENGVGALTKASLAGVSDPTSTLATEGDFLGWVNVDDSTNTAYATSSLAGYEVSSALTFKATYKTVVIDDPEPATPSTPTATQTVAATIATTPQTVAATTEALPETGDTTSTALQSAVLLLAAAAIISMAVYGLRKNR